MTQPTPEQIHETLQKAKTLTADMLTNTQPKALFSQPTEINGQTIFTASEMIAAMGIGQAWGTAGGGGTAGGRPVAIITVRDDDVQIRPIIDLTKIGLALLALVGSYLTLRRQLRV